MNQIPFYNWTCNWRHSNFMLLMSLSICFYFVNNATWAKSGLLAERSVASHRYLLYEEYFFSFSLSKAFCQTWIKVLPVLNKPLRPYGHIRGPNGCLWFFVCLFLLLIVFWADFAVLENSHTTCITRFHCETCPKTACIKILSEI